MSSDNAKENASVVDSSVTDWKQDMGNSDDADTPSYKHNEEDHHFNAEKSGHDGVENSPMNKKGNLYNTRYFIIKSLNHDNIQLSVEKGIWATQVMNEPILEEAFHNSGRVILIFSVNMSGFFQGYAQMISSVGWRRDNIWSQGFGKSNPWGRSFKVKWLKLNDLPFQKTLHLKNPLNDYKPVKISRDCQVTFFVECFLPIYHFEVKHINLTRMCQELPEDIGEALCELIDGESDLDGMLKRAELHPKRPCIEPPCSSGEGYNASAQLIPWPWTPMPYPSFFNQHQNEASRFCLANQGSTHATFPENLPLSPGASRVARTKHSRTIGNLSNLQMHHNVSSQIDGWGMPAESPHASSLTDDDFLGMTYEEYLEVCSRNVKQTAGPSRTTEGHSRSKNRDDDSSSSDQCRPRKRPHHSSEK